MNTDPALVVNPSLSINSSLKGCAQDARERGFSIFALQPRKKEPLQGSRGFKEATTNEVILKRWDHSPDMNVGIATGLSGLCVLDFDKPESVPVWLNETQTYKVRTARGLHIYFRGARKSGKLHVDGQVVGDLKSEGGYVLAAGSIHPSGARYTVVDDSPVAKLPDRVEELLRQETQGNGLAREPVVISPDGPPIPHGAHYTELVRIAGSMRYKGCGENTIYDHLLDCRERCDTPGADFAEMCRKIARHICTYPKGQSPWHEPGREPVGFFEPGGPFDGLPPITGACRKDGPRLNTLRGDSVKTSAIPWLWRNKLPLGEITNFNGLPGEGKSVVTCNVAAAVTTGGKFLDGTENTLGPSEVLILSTEDRPETVLVPRLRAAGADLSKVILIKSTLTTTATGKGGERSVALDADIDAIKTTLRENPNIRLFVIDPVSNHLGKKSMLKEQEVRDVLNELSLDGVATLIVCHLNKNANLGAQQRTMGAGAFTGRARAAFAFVSDLEDKEVHHMVSTKANYAKASGLRYGIETKRITLDDGSTEEVPYVVYLGESTGDADRLLDMDAKRRSDPTKTQRAQDFLQAFLADGPKPQTECVKGARELGISERTLDTAKGNLNVESRKTEDGWMWSLPSVPVALFEGCKPGSHSQTHCTLAPLHP
jgi:putative DNA primase/helicase